jgi:hypothetical protein
MDRSLSPYLRTPHLPDCHQHPHRSQITCCKCSTNRYCNAPPGRNVPLTCIFSLLSGPDSTGQGLLYRFPSPGTIRSDSESYPDGEATICSVGRVMQVLGCNFSHISYYVLSISFRHREIGLATEVQAAFFSYSRDDSEFALRLAAGLKAAGANV